MALADRLRRVFGMAPKTFDEPRVARFSGQIPQLLSELALRRGGRAGREEALEIPALLRGRNLICSIGTLPLEAVDDDNRLVRHPMLRQPDPNVARSVTLAMTVEDLLFDAVAWWRITAFGWDGYPVNAVRYDPGQVRLNPPPGYDVGKLPSGLSTRGVVWMNGEPVPWAEVIRFDSPNPALLVAGRKAITRALALDDAAQLFAENPRMRGWFSPKDASADPGTDEEIQDALDAWATARRERVDGYVPAALDYNTVQDPTPADLQLIQLQEKATKDIANALGIDPEELAVSTTSRTYANVTDRRKDRINDTYSPYMKAITERLSMPDVTKRGVTVRFNLDDYLRADPKTRAEVQAIYKGMGVTDAEEIRHEEGKPPRVIEQPAPTPIPATVGEPVRVIEAGARAGHTFAREGLTFDYAADAAFAVDRAARTITGLAVPWNQVARSGGRRYRFAKGSVKWSAVNRVKLLRDHVNSSAIGKAVRLEDTDAGLVATFQVSAGPSGDEALALAVDEVLDGLSIGVDFRDSDLVDDPQNPGAYLVTSAALREVSLTAVPAFDDSRLTSVTAAREEGTGMPEETTETAPAAQPVTFSAEQFDQLMGALRPAAPAAVVTEQRPTIDPSTRPVATAQVTEPHPYHFSVSNGRTVFSNTAEHDFSTDLFSVLKNQEFGRTDPAAQDRLDSWIRENFQAAEQVSRDRIRATFDVDRADTTDKTSPNVYRPDMYQAQLQYPTPLWDMLNAGPTDERKFDIPKYNSSSGLVGAATEGTEPAAGAMTVTTQTITPTQVWGKVEVTRQAWRIGGNPQLSGLLWGQMLEEYYEDREAAAATFLNTLTAATDITLTGVDASPSNDEYQLNVAQLEAAIADLQFARGGRTIRSFAVHQALYRVLAAVQDDQGRPLYPIVSPSNANGTAQPGYNYIDIAGVRAVPAYGLGSAGGNTTVNSWLFSSQKVFGWADAPERMFWDFGATVQTANIPQLSYVTVGIYGNVAFGNTDIAGVRQVTYDQNTAA